MKKIFQLLSCLSALSYSHAIIPFEAIKNIYKTKKKDRILNKEYDHLCPVFGFLAIKSGLIANLRFYGKMDLAYDKKDIYERNYAQDKGIDAVAKLIKILFPSNGGSLNTESGAKGSLSIYLTPASVAYLMDYAQKLRKEEKVEFNVKDFYATLKKGYEENIHLTEERFCQENGKNFKDLQKISSQIINLEYLSENDINIMREIEKIVQKESQDNDELKYIKENTNFIKNTLELKDFELKEKLLSAQKNNILSKISQKKNKNLKNQKKLEELSNEKYKIINLIFYELFSQLLKEEKIYPKHTTEHILLAFLWQNFNEKKDIGEYYTALSSLCKDYFDKNFLNNTTNVDEILQWQKSRLSLDEIQNYLKDKKIKIDKNLDLEQQVQIAYGVNYFTNLMPYQSGEDLISNGDTHPIVRKENTIQIMDTEKYQDCGEVSLRHFMNFMFYNKEMFDLSVFKEKSNQNQAFKALEDFYKIQNDRSQTNNSNIQIRTEWNKVVAALNSEYVKLDEEFQELKKKNPDFFKVHYVHENNNDNAYELEPGLINWIHTIEHILGKTLENITDNEEIKKDIESSRSYLLQNQNKEDARYNQEYEKYIKNKFKILFNIIKKEIYHFEFESLKSDFNISNSNKSSYDRYDSEIEIAANNNDEDTYFKFLMTAKSDHGVTEIPKNNTRKILLPPNAEDLVKTLATDKIFDKGSFYDIYVENLISDNKSKNVFLRNILENKKQEGLDSVIQYTIGNMGLDDPETAEDIQDVLKEFLHIDKKYFEKIKKIYLPVFDDDDLEKLKTIQNIKEVIINDETNIKLLNDSIEKIYIDCMDCLTENDFSNLKMLKELCSFKNSLPKLITGKKSNIEIIPSEKLEKIDVTLYKPGKINLKKCSHVKDIILEINKEEIYLPKKLKHLLLKNGDNIILSGDEISIIETLETRFLHYQQLIFNNLEIQNIIFSKDEDNFKDNYDLDISRINGLKTIHIKDDCKQIKKLTLDEQKMKNITIYGPSENIIYFQNGILTDEGEKIFELNKNLLVVKK